VAFDDHWVHRLRNLYWHLAIPHSASKGTELMTKIILSSGHGLKIRGASGLIDEVDEARRVVSALAEALRKRRHEVEEIHDDHSTTQDENLAWLCAEHNKRERDLDISVHFNACDPPTDGMRGTECFYQTQTELAALVSAAIADAARITDRGAKYGNFYFLSNTNRPAILIEVCFVDAREDVEAYEANFDAIIDALASVQLHGNQVEFSGTCSHFGGPADSGVAWDEDLAWWWDWDQVAAAGATDLFLSEQPPNTSGLARRLDPEEPYLACRWDYSITPKSMLADQRLLASVYAPKTGKRFLARPADWGPSEEKTGRAADLSPGLMELLGITTDDEVVVVYPVKR
jgi:N-acetylmuramoyl-L-alanine amidase